MILVIHVSSKSQVHFVLIQPKMIAMRHLVLKVGTVIKKKISGILFDFESLHPPLPQVLWYWAVSSTPGSSRTSTLSAGT